MAELTVTSITRDGVQQSLTSASSSGDKFAHSPTAHLVVDNASASSIDVTIASQAVPGPGESKDDKVVSVPDGEVHLIGPFPEQAFADSDGFVNVSYSATSSVTVGAFDVR